MKYILFRKIYEFILIKLYQEINFFTKIDILNVLSIWGKNFTFRGIFFYLGEFFLFRGIFYFFRGNHRGNLGEIIGERFRGGFIFF